MRKSILLCLVVLSLIVAACAAPTQAPDSNGNESVVTETEIPPVNLPITEGGAYPAPGTTGGGYPGPGGEAVLEEDGMMRGEIFMAGAAVQVKESMPVQVELLISGNLPTPCHQIKYKISQPDAENQIMVELYSVSDPDTMCTQVLQPFEETISLGEYASGKYSVWLNGSLIGEFDA